MTAETVFQSNVVVSNGDLHISPNPHVSKKSKESERRRRKRKQKKIKSSQAPANSTAGEDSDAPTDDDAKENNDPQQVCSILLFLLVVFGCGFLGICCICFWSWEFCLLYKVGEQELFLSWCLFYNWSMGSYWISVMTQLGPTSLKYEWVSGSLTTWAPLPLQAGFVGWVLPKVVVTQLVSKQSPFGIALVMDIEILGRVATNRSVKSPKMGWIATVRFVKSPYPYGPLWTSVLKEVWNVMIQLSPTSLKYEWMGGLIIIYAPFPYQSVL